MKQLYKQNIIKNYNESITESKNFIYELDTSLVARLNKFRDQIFGKRTREHFSRTEVR